MKPLWEALYAADADVVLNGHDHNSILEPIANSELYNDETYGVLQLTLNPKSYEWRFIAVEGETFTDSGSARCH